MKKHNQLKNENATYSKKLDEANELLYENGIKERPYKIDHRGA